MALPIFIGEKMAKHILSCSFGKDSIATALLALRDRVNMFRLARRVERYATRKGLQLPW